MIWISREFELIHLKPFKSCLNAAVLIYSDFVFFLSDC